MSVPSSTPSTHSLNPSVAASPRPSTSSEAWKVTYSPEPTTTAACLSAPTIHAIAKARIYHTHLDSPSHNEASEEWLYSRLKGTLTFGRNWSSSLHGSAGYNRESIVGGDAGGGYWFTLADNMTGKTIWMFQVPSTSIQKGKEGFLYEVDRPFFHVFNGRTRKYGFLFEDDDEASLFARKVINETCKDAHTRRSRSRRPARRASTSSTKSSSTSFKSKTSFRSKSPPTISAPAPNSFRHVSHVGVNALGVFEISKDLDGAFKESLIKLSGIGAGEGGKKIVVMDTSTFLDSFWKDVDNARAERGSLRSVALASIEVC